MKSEKRFIFVINPISGGKEKEEFISKLEKKLSGLDLKYEIFKTSGEDDQQKLRKKIEEFDPYKVTAIGGDGTIHLVASQIINTDRILGIIPFGSANGLAKELQIPVNPVDALTISLNDKYRTIDTLKINNEIPCIHISDIGFNARIIKNFEKNQIRGMIGYAMEFFKEFQMIEPMEVIVKNKDIDVWRTTYMAVIANGQMYGSGARINSKGKLDDGKFEVCLIKDISVARLLDLLFNFNEQDFEFIERWSTTEIRIRTKQKSPFQVDGELIGDFKEVTAKIEPSSLKIAAP